MQSDKVSLAEETGISKSHMHRIMHELDLKPHQFRMWLFSNDGV